MHELGVLVEVVRIVRETAQRHRIRSVTSVTLSVGEDSGYLPVFLEKLFPVAAENIPVIRNAKLVLESVPGRGLSVKEIGY